MTTPQIQWQTASFLCGPVLMRRRLIVGDVPRPLFIDTHRGQILGVERNVLYVEGGSTDALRLAGGSVAGLRQMAERIASDTLHV